MSKPTRLLTYRPFFFTSTSTQSLSRCAALSFSPSLSIVRPSRQRLLYTTRPLCATIVTSATSSTPSVDVGVSPNVESSERKHVEIAQLLRAPTHQDIEEAELDVEVLPPPEECMVFINERAAEQLRRISTRENDPDVALRISVESGGCHGYQYKLDLTSVNERQPDDYVFAHPTLRPSNILVDAISLPLLKGSTLDFVTELIGSSFRVSDNPQAKGSGCGCGVSWELKI